MVYDLLRDSITSNHYKLAHFQREIAFVNPNTRICYIEMDLDRLEARHT